MNFQEKYPCQYQFVVIEGNIGAGKTSLAKRISKDYSAKLILERFADNPFLPKFYEDQSRYAFPVEMSFLADRYNQLKQDLQGKDIFSSFTIADYYFMKSLIFARNTLAADEYSLYAQLFHIIYQALPKPDLYVYLHTGTDQLLKNISARGRDFETEITGKYLENIQEGYFGFFKQQPDLRILVVDINGIDFVSNDNDYEYLVSQLFSKTYKLGTNWVRCKD
ncbi:MAG: deoxynucleoside kinase [Bacteroidales bacterium]|nr:deoxynucleoside kinase [Bacteroidales bacterium]